MPVYEYIITPVSCATFIIYARTPSDHFPVMIVVEVK